MTLPSPTNQSICPDGTQPEQPADQPMPQGCTTVQNFEDHSDPPSHPSLPPGELPSGDVLPVLSDDDPSDDVLPLLLDEPHEQLVPTRHTAKPHGSQPLPPDDPQPDGPLPRPRSATGDCGGGRDNERGAEGGAAEGSVGGVDAGGAGGETAPPPSLAPPLYGTHTHPDPLISGVLLPQDFTALPGGINPRASLLWKMPAHESHGYGSFGHHPVVGDVRFGKCPITGLSFGYFYRDGDLTCGPFVFLGSKNSSGGMAAAPQRLPASEYVQHNFAQVREARPPPLDHR